MKIALAPINPIVGDFNYNFKKVKDFAADAARRGCDLVVFPDLAISSSPFGTYWRKRILWPPAWPAWSD
jgi:NAD+ synthase (glutamine-hydrolysing)